MQTYRLFGLDIASEIDLGAGLPASGGLSDVVIRRGSVPAEMAGAVQEEGWFAQAPGVSLLNLPVARFLVRDGREILVDGNTGDTPMLTWRLLGLAFGALLHQRGVLTLHSTVIRAGDAAIGFVGQSGAGKSTLAAMLGQRGHDLLIDDLCALTFQDDAAWVQPGPARLRLWSDMVEALGVTGQAQLDPALGKYELPTAPFFPQPLLLRSLIVLESGPVIKLEALDAARRFATVIDHTYARAMLPGQDRKAANFMQCRELAGSVPMFRLTRPKDFSANSAVMDAVEQAIAGLSQADMLP